MNKREIVFTVLVTFGLILTASSFSSQKAYDCSQPLFSDASSCSITGGSCVNFQSKSGFGGLWSYFTGFELKEDTDGFTLSGVPGCSVEFKKVGDEDE